MSQIAHADEQTRQAAVLAACQALLPAGIALEACPPCLTWVQTARLKVDTAGMLAYQHHALATAGRALAHTFPTIQAMLGEQALEALAVTLWQTKPPTSGDLGEWGQGLPDLLASHPALQQWPWLADSARLDWAVHLCERAADAELDTDSLQLLSHAAPDSVTLTLQPQVHILASSWPVAALLEAHRQPASAQAAAAFVALSQGATGPVVVSRQPWRAQTHTVSDAFGQWMCALLDARSEPAPAQTPLSVLLDQAHPDFDFTQWLTMALREGWLWRVQPITGRSA